MEIGISTSALPRNHWDRLLDGLPFRAVEVNLRNSKFTYDPSALAVIREALSGYDLSSHSRTTNLFHPEEMVAREQAAILDVDLWRSAAVGVKEVVFHVSKQCGETEPEVLRERVRGFRGKLLLENNRKGFMAGEREMLELLDEVPGLGVCLDLGHLRSARDRGLVEDEAEFVRALGNRIVNVHVHQAQDGHDTHRALRPGVDNRAVLGAIREAKPRKLVIENHNVEDAMETVRVLKEFGFPGPGH